MNFKGELQYRTKALSGVVTQIFWALMYIYLYTAFMGGKIIDGFADDLSSLFYDDSGRTAKRNLDTMMQKLLLLQRLLVGYCELILQFAHFCFLIL